MTSDELKETRLSLAITQQQLANELGVSGAAVSSFERSKTAFRPRTGEKLIGALLKIAQRDYAEHRRQQTAELMAMTAD
jgi:transcriptional regulator with XRE-family HTH domain